MDIQKEIKISENQPAVFIADTELGELYRAAVKHWRLDEDNCLVFTASLFYNLGRTHGIRAERARRRAGAVNG